MLQRELLQQRSRERSMHPQVRIALLLTGVSAIVVNAVAIEGECRITKQECGVRLDGAAPIRHRFVPLHGGWSLRSRDAPAVDDILLLRDSRRPIAADDMLDRHEPQGSAL